MRSNEILTGVDPKSLSVFHPSDANVNVWEELGYSFRGRMNFVGIVDLQ